ncbi:hypothetical protein INT45_005303 [Circinella minor]|uniref:No apical meristem-associated C-terminal domain-containing protein n=1 Tax=Circinella minor TaxID=1195481 RepID=A0A8H7S8M5_9FUNG|nr:hypothetical protein INT45_005303 [Circinella minor]
MPTTPTTTPTIVSGTNTQRKKKEVGDDMSDETMWSLIKSTFIMKTGDLQSQDTTSLKSRFNSISSKCQYFSANYTKVMAQPHSGENDNDMYEQACEKYVDFRPPNSGKNFGLKHVWDILKEEPKWKPQVPKPNNEAEAVDGTTKRPTGKHKAKENKEKRRANDKESAEAQALEMVRIQQEIDRDRAKAILMSAQSEMLMAKHEIMKVNLHGLSDQQQEYYQIMQRHILDELKEEMELPKKKQKEMVNVEGEDEEEEGDREEEEEEEGDGEEEEEEEGGEEEKQ